MEEERKKVKKYLCETYGNEIIKYNSFIYLVDIFSRNKESIKKLSKEYEILAKKYNSTPQNIKMSLMMFIKKTTGSCKTKQFVNYNILKIWN